MHISIGKLFNCGETVSDIETFLAALCVDLEGHSTNAHLMSAPRPSPHHTTVYARGHPKPSLGGKRYF